jgi:hypothetical protein
MNTFELLQKAIIEKKSISFDYNKKGELSHRIWDPYVLYIYKSKTNWSESTKLGIVQTSGDSDSKDSKPFPSFRDFLAIEDILNVKILEDQPCFTFPFHEDYNPDSDRYENIIAKI